MSLIAKTRLLLVLILSFILLNSVLTINFNDKVRMDLKSIQDEIYPALLEILETGSEINRQIAKYENAMLTDELHEIMAAQELAGRVEGHSQAARNLLRSDTKITAEIEDFISIYSHYNREAGRIYQAYLKDPTDSAIQQEVVGLSGLQQRCLQSLQELQSLLEQKMMTKIESTERNTLLRGNISLWSSFALIFIALFAIYYFSDKIIWRIGLLKSAATRLGNSLSEEVPEMGSDELGMLARSMENMRQDLNRQHKELRLRTHQAEESLKAKSTFLANMSHEIRTPMNSILGMAEMLSESELTGEQRRYIDTFRRSGENLLFIINDILDFSKIEAGRFELDFEDFDLKKLFEDTHDLLFPRAFNKQISLEFRVAENVPAIICGDHRRLWQVLFNLIGNAIKFTDRGSIVYEVKRIAGHAWALPQPTQVELLFKVSDTGIGIPKDKQATIFESFTQVDASLTRNYGGTGLGLAISLKLVELMGGKIWVESEANSGSTFYFTVSFKNRSTGSEPEKNEGGPVLSEPSPESRKMERRDAPKVKDGSKTWNMEFLRGRVLFVDDSEDNRMLIEAYLSKSKLDIDYIDNGKTAVAMVKQNLYDMVFMDIQMPIMDGLQATKEIRDWESKSGRQPMPILSLSAHAMEEDRAKSRQAGCQEHLTKPISKQKLLEAMAKYLPKAGSET